jgi:hypothetical protein
MDYVLNKEAGSSDNKFQNNWMRDCDPKTGKVLQGEMREMNSYIHTSMYIHSCCHAYTLIDMTYSIHIRTNSKTRPTYVSYTYSHTHIHFICKHLCMYMRTHARTHALTHTGAGKQAG